MPKIKSYKHLLSLILGFLIFAVLIFVLYKSPYYEDLKIWTEQNKNTYIAFLITIKVIGLVWPPIPGGTITLASIPFLGWELAYLSDFIGSLIGTVIAFEISRKYGRKLLSKILDDSTLEKITALKIRKNRQFEMLLFIFVLGGSTVVEVIAYGAGLIKSVKLKNFIIARLISHLLIGVPTYYLAHNIISGKNLIVNILLVVLLIPIMWKLRYRYIEI